MNFVFEIVLFVNVVCVTLPFEHFVCDLLCERCVGDLFLFVNVVFVILLCCGSCVCDVFILPTIVLVIILFLLLVTFCFYERCVCFAQNNT